METVPAPIAPPTLSRRYGAWTLGALAVGLLLLGTLARFGTSDDPSRARAGVGLATAGPLMLGKMRLLTLEERLETDPRISPDGSLIVYSSGNLRQRRIYVRPVAGGRAFPVTGDANVLQYQPRWSPDGREILYISPQGAFVVPAKGGTPMPVAAQPQTDGREASNGPSLESGFSIHSAAWSPTGRQVAFTSGGSLAVTSLATGTVHTLVQNYKVILHSCDWSPDGNWIACVGGNWAGSVFDNRSPSGLVVVPSAGGALVEVTDMRALHLSPAWSSTSGRLYFVSNRDGANDIYWVDMKDGKGVEQPVRATTGLGAHSIAFSRDDSRLVYASVASHANVWSLPIPATEPVDSAGAQPVTTGNQTIETLRVSLDGRWLLYDSNQQGNADVFRVSTAGGAVEQLTSDPADDFAPDLSPDGRYIAFHSWRAQSRDVFVRAVGGGPAEQVTSSPAQEMYPTWSPDGRALVFYDATVDAGSFRGPFLVRRRPSGTWGAPEALRSIDAACRPPVPCRLAWSRDGTFLVYAHAGAVMMVRPESGASRAVYTPSSHSRDPRAELVLVGDDSATLFFKSHDSSGRASLWSVPVSGGPPVLRVRFDDPSRQSMRPDFAVGAGRFFFTIEDYRSNVWIADVTGR